MITKTFETIKSCYFQGVSYQIVWNCPKASKSSGNESFFTVSIVYDDGHNVQFSDLGKEFDTQCDAAKYARNYDNLKALERDEIRYNVQ